MPLGITKRQIDRTAFNAVHNPPNPTDNIKASKTMGMEKNRMAKELAPFLMYLYKKYLKATIFEGTDLDMLKLINKAMRQMPGSPAQKKTLEKLNAMRKSVGMKPIGEGIDNPKYTDGEPKPASVYGFESPVDTKKELDKEVDTDVIPGGLAKGMSLRDIADHHGVDFEQMKEYAKLGVKTELEHTTDSEIAYEITKDHLYEDPEYYIKLSKIEEDLRNWFGKGKTGSTDGGGWDRYGSDGQKLGKCGDGEKGDAYAACLSKEKAAKLGPKGRASFVRRKRADQKKAGDTKKGGNRTKGKTPTFSKTKANEDINIPINVGDTVLGGKFKNKRIVVKSIDKNEKGDITINGKPLLKYRLMSEGKIESELEGKYDVSVDVYEYPTYIELKRIVVPDDKRSSGIGTKVMTDLIKYAETNNKDLFTTPSSDFGGSKPRLIKFYKSFGFKNNKGSNRDFRSKESMVRVNEGVWSKSALNNMNRKSMDAKYFLSDENGNILPGPYRLKTMSSVHKTFKISKTWGGFDGVMNPEIVNVHDLKKDGKVVDQYKWTKQGAFLKDIESKYINYKNIEKGLDESTINEIPMGDLQKIDQFADKKLNPVDVVLTDKHFFDRLNDPRNGKEISQAELIGFFKRLSKKRKEFVEFLNKYNSLVAVDDRTNINIPFMKQANKAIAKTIMRKKDFKTPDKKLDI